MFRQYKLKDYRFSLILWVICISIMGIMIIGSAKESSQTRQIFGLIIGLIIMLVVSMIDYTWLLKFTWIYYLAGIVLLALVFVIGVNVNGATRWIQIGIQFQPSDLMKIIMILFFSQWFAMNENRINRVSFIGITLVLLAIPLFLIVKEPDLSTTIATALTFCVIIFTAGLSFKIVGAILLVTIPAGVIMFSMILNKTGSLLEGYQVKRILAWLKPELYPDLARQQQNSIIAIGSGQLYGKGLNNNMVSSVKGGDFIAEPQTDFIFAVAGEELGFLGCCLIIILEFLIALECIRIGRRCKELAGSLIACGVGSLIMIQSFMNIAVTTGLMPNTGIPLPFVSYGITSLVTMCIGIGIVLNIGLHQRKY